MFKDIPEASEGFQRTWGGNKRALSAHKIADGWIEMAA